uniref:Uncharacterized protein n=1 Tax=Anguilla anguilla TaxID=7936 RepID=A0A0E9T7R0_ANGAN
MCETMGKPHLLLSVCTLFSNERSHMEHFFKNRRRLTSFHENVFHPFYGRYLMLNCYYATVFIICHVIQTLS